MAAHPVYWGRNDFELVLLPFVWRLISGFAFAQFLRLIRVLAVRMKKNLGPYLTIAKFRGVSLRTFAEFLREISRRKPSAK